jgi:hypothetical protein
MTTAMLTIHKILENWDLGPRAFEVEWALRILKVS